MQDGPSPPKKQNCWEFHRCGREPGGVLAGTHGVCRASTDEALQGINHGDFGGRICWAVNGTFCGGREAADMAGQRPICMNCEFFEKVLTEEGDAVVLTRPDQTRWVARDPSPPPLEAPSDPVPRR